MFTISKEASQRTTQEPSLCSGPAPYEGNPSAVLTLINDGVPIGHLGDIRVRRNTEVTGGLEKEDTVMSGGTSVVASRLRAESQLSRSSPPFSRLMSCNSLPTMRILNTRFLNASWGSLI